jgi:uncharacterized protein (DUF2147 family)
MKGLSFFIVCLVFLLVPSPQAQETGGDAILGQWLTENDKSVVEIYPCGERYCGKILWLEEPRNPDGTDKRDDKNPDPSKRDQKIIGLNLVWDFTYDKANRWGGGKIYDPETGKTYSCKIELEADKLNVRGYIGFSLLGRTTVWTRKH